MIEIRMIYLCASFLLTIVSFSRFSDALKYNLNSQEWTICDTQRLCIKGQVPGGIYTSLQKSGKIQDPLLAGNDVQYRKYARNDWTYTTTVKVDSSVITKSSQIYLIFNGIDTLADISLNGRQLGYVDDMFLRYRFNVKNILQSGNNQLEIRIYSPIAGANNQSSLFERKYGYNLPPKCNPPEYDGECHVNMIRKMQASFGWDWGPAFPSMGIWQPVEIETVESTPILRDFTAIPFLSTLYDLSVEWTPKGGSKASLKKRIGFRTVEIVQEPIGNKGLSFKVQVNGYQMFIRGTNVIPISIFPEVQPENYVKHLMKSVKKGHMNMIRVWGGGVYESDYLYNLADEMGIMVWQDFMFACATYPATDSFLKNVQAEVVQQMERLQHHPSVAIWAGNNENELAIASPWWPEILTRKPTYKRDYVALYFDTIGKTLAQVNPMAVYVPSSPSNGKETIKEGGIAVSPGDVRYGDVHFYGYNNDPWNYNYYPSGKFVSEYGIQSYPSLSTLSKVIPQSQLVYPLSQSLLRRQHQPKGNDILSSLISYHFNLPRSGDQKQLAKYIYQSQILQAVAIKSQTEFYLRNRQPDIRVGTGMTYGAMYWQLNDVWQAPTWSSIEYGGKWKLLHYYMVKTFNPANAIAFVDSQSGNLTIALVNDYLNLISMKVTGEVQRFKDILPVTFFEQNFKNAPRGVNIIFSEPLNDVLNAGWCITREHCMIKLNIEHSIADQSGSTEVLENFLLISSPKNFVGLQSTQVRVTKVSKISTKTGYKYQIDLETDHVALFVILDLDPSMKVNAIFSDNGFMMTSKKKSISVETNIEVSTKDLTSGLRITHLLNNLN
ncbi:beta-mannosidase isoform X2 [Brevipalpus obovatus]|uniref:beta-mannosidase isoform X2 n=1 Tax=Brevipalpus obovatus TaxID=246614 RepID=UPI003D9E3FD8